MIRRCPHRGTRYPECEGPFPRPDDLDEHYAWAHMIPSAPKRPDTGIPWWLIRDDAPPARVR